MHAYLMLKKTVLDNWLTDGGEVVSLMTLRPSPHPPRRFLILISVRDLDDPRAVIWLEGLGQLKSLMTWSGMEPLTFGLVVQCLNPPHFRFLPRMQHNYCKSDEVFVTNLKSGGEVDAESEREDSDCDSPVMCCNLLLISEYWSGLGEYDIDSELHYDRLYWRSRAGK
jgi:hypothetical protein